MHVNLPSPALHNQMVCENGMHLRSYDGIGAMTAMPTCNYYVVCAFMTSRRFSCPGKLTYAILKDNTYRVSVFDYAGMQLLQGREAPGAR